MKGIKVRAALACLAAALMTVCPAARGENVWPAAAECTVDFDYLRQVNDDIVGWLYQPGGELNTVIVQSEDNDYYQNRLIDRSISYHGTPFMDCDNDFSDPAIYIFAHNTEETEEFAFFDRYLEQAYYTANARMTLIAPDDNKEAVIFAGVETTVRDGESWRLPENAAKETFEAFVDGLVSQSFLSPDPADLPQWGDQLLALVTCAPTGRRYVLYARLRSVEARAEAAVDVNKLTMDSRGTLNKVVSVKGIGSFMVYAQNDELWSGLRFEAKGSGKKRTFGEGGCGPTAAAMAIANLVDKEELPKLAAYADSATGFTFCSCSANNYVCSRRHIQYQLKTPEEFLRYLPLAVAGFASGNNQWHIRSRGTGQGTNMAFLKKLCEIYDISVTTTRVAAEAIEMLKEGNGNRIVLSCATKGSPFTIGGHFVIMAAADDEYVYLLDPLRDNDYERLDKRHLVEELAPGVVRIKVENAARCNLSPHYILEKKQ